MVTAGIQRDRGDSAVAYPVLVSVGERIGGGGICASDWVLHILDHDQGPIEHEIDRIIG